MLGVMPCDVMQVRISKHLTDLEQMFYGTSLTYDKVGDACLCNH